MPKRRFCCGFEAGQRERAHGASVEGAEEGDHVLALGVIAGQLERGFNRFGAGVAVVNPVRPGHGSDFRHPLRQRDHALVVEIRARHVDQFARLLLNRSHHIGMAMSGRGHGDAGGEIEKFVAVHIGNHDAAALLGHQRVGAGVRRRNILLVARENALGIGAGQSSLDFGVLQESWWSLDPPGSSRQSSVVGRQPAGGRAEKRRIQPLSHISWEDGRTSRYRTSWDAPARATLPDDGAGTPESPASTRAGANWASDGASGNIPCSL